MATRRTIGLRYWLLSLSFTGVLLAPALYAQDHSEPPDQPQPNASTNATPEATDLWASSQQIYLPLVQGTQNTDIISSLPPVVEMDEATVGDNTPQQETEKQTGTADVIAAELQSAPPAGQEALAPEPEGLKSEEDISLYLASPSATNGWTTVMRQGFEGIFPSAGWRVFDGDGSANGSYHWDDVNFQPYSGSWSSWIARGGSNGLDPRYYNYPNYMRSWMIFGPFDLSNAADAELLFYYWNKSEPNYDYFRWMASVNGSNFYGYRTSGDTAGWRYVNFDLTAVPTLGNLAGRSQVWIAFYFTSDYSNVNRGAFVDNIVLQKLVNSSITCTNQYKAEYFNNRDLNGVPVVTRCENWPINHDWGNGSPASTVNADNFSARWTGTAYFNAGTYTFRATADDGVRVWLDGSLLIDAWRDQGATTYESTRQVSAGNHTIKMEYYENGGGALAAFAWHQATNKKVVLDPGHGWCAANPGPNCTITPGAVNNGMNLKEKDVVLDIAFRTKSLLEARGVQVFMTRTGDDPYHTLSYAAQFVNEKAPDLSVSIHANAGGGTGTEACYQGNKTTTEASKALSTQMTNEIASLLTLRNRGIFSEYDTGRCGRGNQLYIHNMNPTAMLIETAFIDTTDDATKLRDRRQDFAQAIANAILRQLGLR